MKVFASIQNIRKERCITQPYDSWGFVPTMGFLHEGHLSLVRRARLENEYVGVSIFVNPIQFNDPYDLSAYPCNLENDLKMLGKEGVDLVWTPSSDIVYLSDHQTYVTVEEVSKPLEGVRAGHFRGVATVVAKLLNVFQPHQTYFGQKDAQQVLVVKQMVKDLNFNTEIIVCPTIREPDGLAMSSRNAKLTPAGRKKAVCLYKALLSAKKAFISGEKDAEKLRLIIRETIYAADSATRIDYISAADPHTLLELEKVEDKALLSLAVFIDNVRLIDNVLLQRREREEAQRKINRKRRY